MIGSLTAEDGGARVRILQDENLASTALRLNYKLDDTLKNVHQKRYDDNQFFAIENGNELVFTGSTNAADNDVYYYTVGVTVGDDTSGLEKTIEFAVDV